MAKLPFMKFFPRDWKNDPALSKCSPATRGIWMDLICTMHEDGQSGKVSGTIEELAREGRCTPRQLRAAIDELELKKAANVSRNIPKKSTGSACRVTLPTGSITLINRRMRVQAKEREQSTLRSRKYRKKQKRHGDITLESSEVRYQKAEKRDAKGMEEREREARSAHSESLSETFLEELQARPEFRHKNVRYVLAKYRDHQQAKGLPEDKAQFILWCHNERVDESSESSSDRIARVVAMLGGDH